MKGDFSRITFDPKKHYSRVLMQQGRVQLDADWNEQAAIILHRLETMARDLIGPFGGPAAECGFEITVDVGGSLAFGIGRGRYYVDGILCDADDNATKFDIKELGNQDRVFFDVSFEYLVYVDVWEQYINAVEDPNILEPALGGAETSGRSKVVWSFHIMALQKPAGDSIITGALQRLQSNQGRNGRLKVETKTDDHNDGPCILPPNAGFRGLENQLYRVEVHIGGKASEATFKWSRENGSIIFPIAHADGQVIVLDPLCSTMGLKSGDWVELVQDDLTAQVLPKDLLKIKFVDSLKREVTMMDKVQANAQKHPYLRRWEGAAITIVEDHLFTLEDGIQITFVKSQDGQHGQHTYRAGDFWCIPARTAGEGRVTWPAAVPPDGVIHHYAPLAVLTLDGNNKFTKRLDCRMKFAGIGIPITVV